MNNEDNTNNQKKIDWWEVGVAAIHAFAEYGRVTALQEQLEREQARREHERVLEDCYKRRIIESIERISRWN